MVTNVKTSPAVLQFPVVVVNSGACAIVVTLIQRLREDVKSAECQATGITFLHSQRGGVIGTVAKVGV